MHVFLRCCKIVGGRSNVLKRCGHCHNSITLNRRYTDRWLHVHLSATSNLCTYNTAVRYNNENNVNRQWVRNVTVSTIRYDKEGLKPSSKVEVTVNVLKEQKQVKRDGEKDETAVASLPVPAKTLRQRIVDELVHYYHGFRLLFIDIKISSHLVWRILNGNALTRREHRLLVRTTGDLFRLLPFSVFIIVPFMEFLLPVAIKLFPGMLPSTFQTARERENKVKQNLKMKLEMAKFLQTTLDEMSVQHHDHNSQQAKQFAEWFQKVRTSGENVSNEDILKYSKLFEDEITLDSLSRGQLVALCRVLDVSTLGPNNFLRFQLRMKLRSLVADDKVIQKEGISSLTLAELQQACRARGMRAYGMSEDRLRMQLAQWLDLSLNEKVPPSLLLLSRALMLPETIATEDQLKATISALPEHIVTSTKAAIGEAEGKIDNKVKMQVIKEEERLMKEERKERKKQEDEQKIIDEKKRKDMEADKEVLTDGAPVLSTAAATPIVGDKEKVEVETKDMQALEDAVLQLTQDKKFVVEKEDIQELKEEMAEYQEDLQELHKVTADEGKPAIKERIASQRLYKKVNKMIGKMDTVLRELQEKEAELKKGMEETTEDAEATQKQEEILRIDDIIAALRQIKGIGDESRVEQIENILSKIDDDRDGIIRVEDVMKIIDVIGNENVKLSQKQIDEIIDLLSKEEVLEVEEKIEKVLQKEKENAEEVERVAEKNASEMLQRSDKDATSKVNACTEESHTKSYVPGHANSASTESSKDPCEPPVPPIVEIDKTVKKSETKTL